MSQNTIQPDSPFKICTSGKYKLLIKAVTNCISYFEYLLSDAEGKEYKATADALYSEGQLLRCMVNLKGEKGRLVVDNVAICKKQDLAIPITVIKKPEPKPIIEVKSKQKITAKNKSQSVDNKPVKRLGNPSKRLMSGIYYFRVKRYEINDHKKQEFYCYLEDAEGKEYTFISKQYLDVSRIYPFRVKVSSALGGGIRVDVISVAKPKKEIHYNNPSGYKHRNDEPTIYKGGAHLIYTPMGNKR